MKILITVHSYYPRKDGVSVITQYLAEGLAMRGNQVKVITASHKGYKKYETHHGLSIQRINFRTRFGICFGNKSQYRELIQKETDWADVMINVCTQNAFTDVILKNIDNYKCKKMLYMHGMFDFKLRAIYFGSFAGTINKLWKEVRWFSYYAFNGKYFKKYDSVVQLHEKDNGNLFFEKKYGINSIIIGNAADDIFFEHKDLTKFKKPFDKYIIVVANYGDQKNQKLAIKEFLKSSIDPKIGLVLIGSEKNSYYDYLEHFTLHERNKMNLGNDEKPVLQLFGVNRDTIVSYISNAYLSLLTSKCEVFPVSIIESIVSEVPYICTDVGIVKYLPGGLVSKKKEIHCLIEKMMNDSKYYQYWVDQCRQQKDHYKIDCKVDALEKELKRILKQ